MYQSPYILDIELNNFSRPYAGMGKSTIYIDFTVFIYKLFILVGDNGTGKTSLMSCFHPFAYNLGTVSNNDLIREGKSGYKKMHIGYLDNIYYIQHFYNRKKDGTLGIRSYISENDTELNETGLVGTFKEIVEEKLGIHEDFLTLLFLGDSVKGFVEFTSGDRKKYAATIFQNLQIFSKYYKAASAYLKNARTLMQDNARKLQKFGNIEIEDLKSQLAQWKKKVANLDASISEISTKRGSLMEKINSDQATIDQYNEKQKRIRELIDEIDIQKRKVGQAEDEVVLRNRIKDISEKIQSHQIRLAALDVTVKADIEIFDLKTREIKELESNIERMKSYTDFKELTKLKSKLESDIIKLDIKGVIRPEYTTKELITIQVYLDELKGLCVDLTTNVVNLDLIEDTLRTFQSDEFAITKAEAYCDTVSDQYNNMIGALKTRELLKVLDKIDTIPCKNFSACEYYKFYESVSSVLFCSKEMANGRIEAKKKELCKAEDIVTINHIIKKLYDYITEHDSFTKIPEKIFDPTTFIFSYMEKREIYDFDLLTSLIDLVERFDQYDTLKEKLDSVNKQLDSVQDTKELKESMERKLIPLREELSLIEARLEKGRENILYNEEELKKAQKLKDSLEETLTSVINLSTLRIEMQLVKKEIAGIEGTMSLVSAYKDELDTLTKREELLRGDQANARAMENNLTTQVQQLGELQSEQAELIKKCHDAELVQEATSPTKGIPVEFLSEYLKGPLLHEVNRLLKPVYNGKVEILINKCVVNDKEFTIPYRVGNSVVWDISSASDGQKAIFSLAFSLAFSKLIRKENRWFYCIFLFDEKDAKLDSHSRAEYVNMVTTFMEDIKAPQLFLISHNAMFEGYPVNILMTSNTNVSNMSQSQILRVYEKE